MVAVSDLRVQWLVPSLNTHFSLFLPIFSSSPTHSILYLPLHFLLSFFIIIYCECQPPLPSHIHTFPSNTRTYTPLLPHTSRFLHSHWHLHYSWHALLAHLSVLLEVQPQALVQLIRPESADACARHHTDRWPATGNAGRGMCVQSNIQKFINQIQCLYY